MTFFEVITERAFKHGTKVKTRQYNCWQLDFFPRKLMETFYFYEYSHWTHCIFYLLFSYLNCFGIGMKSMCLFYYNSFRWIWYFAMFSRFSAFCQCKWIVTATSTVRTVQQNCLRVIKHICSNCIVNIVEYSFSICLIVKNRSNLCHIYFFKNERKKREIQTKLPIFRFDGTSKGLWH